MSSIGGNKQWAHLLMTKFPIETTFIPNDGFENNNDSRQMTGIMATLYSNRIKNTNDNSLMLFHWSCWPKSSSRTIIVMVIQLVSTSHMIDAAQKIGKFTPLAYCRKRALHSFSCYGYEYEHGIDLILLYFKMKKNSLVYKIQCMRQIKRTSKRQWWSQMNSQTSPYPVLRVRLYRCWAEMVAVCLQRVCHNRRPLLSW